MNITNPIKTTSLVASCLVSCLLPLSSLFAASDGYFGQTSTGNINITLTTPDQIVPRLAVTGLEDIIINTTQNEAGEIQLPNSSITGPVFCVYGENFTQYRVTAQSANSPDLIGQGYLNGIDPDTSNPISILYSYHIPKPSSISTSSQVFDLLASNESDCSGELGMFPFISLTDFQPDGPVPHGVSYTDQLIITVTPL